MKKNLVIIRFGISEPLRNEIDLILREICAPEDQDLAMGRPFFDMGVVSVVRTRLSPAEVAMKFEEFAAANNDLLPVVVIDLDSNGASINIGDEGFRKMLQEFQAGLAKRGETDQTKKLVEMSLDELLDLVNHRGGIDQLSTEELERLEKLSKK